MHAMSHDLPYRGRLVACEVCGRLGVRSEVRPTITVGPDGYRPITRCRDRARCESEREQSARDDLREAVLAR